MVDFPRYNSSSQLASQWKKIALMHHPDRGGSRNTFMRIQAAYKILKEPHKRRMYDRYNVVDYDIFPYNEQLLVIWMSVQRYFTAILLAIPVTPRNKSLNALTRSIQLIMVLFFLDIFNSFARKDSLSDPFDYLFPYMSLYQRSNFILTCMPAILMLNFIYMNAFGKTWIEDTKQILDYSIMFLEQLVIFDKNNTKHYEKQIVEVDRIWKRVRGVVFKQKPKPKQEDENKENSPSTTTNKNDETTKASSSSSTKDSEPRSKDGQTTTKRNKKNVRDLNSLLKRIDVYNRNRLSDSESLQKYPKYIDDSDDEGGDQQKQRNGKKLLKPELSMFESILEIVKSLAYFVLVFYFINWAVSSN